MAIASAISSASGDSLILPELALDRLQLLAQQKLALPRIDLLLRLLADLARELEHLEPVRRALDDLVEPLANRVGFQHFLLFGRTDVEQARDEVGQSAGRLDRLQCRKHLGGACGSRSIASSAARCRSTLARASISASLVFGSRDRVVTRREKRQARNEVERFEALLALADQVMHPVRRRHVSDHADDRAGLVEVVGTGILGGAVSLQQDAELVVPLDGFAGRIDRDVAAERDLRHGAREDDEIANGEDQQNVLGNLVAAGLFGRCFSCVARFHEEFDLWLPDSFSGGVGGVFQPAARGWAVLRLTATWPRPLSRARMAAGRLERDVMLEVNPETVRFIIDKAHEFQVGEDTDLDDDESEMNVDDRESWELEERVSRADHPAYQELKTTIDDLEPDQQMALVALMWVGRGDYAAEEWRAALEHASTSWNERTADYLIGTPLVADYLNQGLEELGY